MKNLDFGVPASDQDWQYVYRALTEIQNASRRQDQADTDIASLQAGAIPTIDLTGGQIAFPATQVPSNGVNVLDDYEEGTFTPGFSFGGGTTGITYSVQTGVYTKIGRVVFFSARVAITNNGSSVGNWLLTGLPFTANASYHNAATFWWKNASVSTAANGYSWQVRVEPNTTTVSFWENYNGVGPSAAQMTDAYTTNTTEVIVSGHYVV